MDTVAYTDAGVRQVKRTDHLLNWKLVILVVVLLTSYIDSSDKSEIVQCCQGGNSSFTWNYTLLPFIVIEWYVNDTQLAETSEPSFSRKDLHINDNYTHRFRLHKDGDVGFYITNVTEEDEGDYKFLVTLSNGTVNTLKKKLQVSETTLGEYDITETKTTENCSTLKCREPLGTNTKYLWSIRVNDTNEEQYRTTTNTLKFCLNHFKFSAKCQRDYDCTETTWTCFKTSQSGRRRWKRRTLDEQLVPCYEDTDSGNVDDSSPMTIGIAVAVVAVVIAIAIVVIRRKLKSRAERRPDSFKVETPACSECLDLVDKTHQPDKETCEQVNLNQKT